MARAKFDDVRGSNDARESLAGLSRAFTAAQFDDYDVRKDLRKMRREDLLYKPEEKEGIRLLKGR